MCNIRTIDEILWSVVSATRQNAKNRTLTALAYFYDLSFDVKDRSFLTIICYCMGVSLRSILTPVSCVCYEEYLLSAINFKLHRTENVIELSFVKVVVNFNGLLSESAEDTDKISYRLFFRLSPVIFLCIRIELVATIFVVSCVSHDYCFDKWRLVRSCQKIIDIFAENITCHTLL